MPVNDFSNYPMAWKPEKDKLHHPIYLSLAEQLEQDILDGKLQENVKLPPQRELADFLDLNLSTITRAYKICEEKGLLNAVVGKGTFISPHINASTSVIDQNAHSHIEMGIVQPYHEDNKIICEVAKKILSYRLQNNILITVILWEILRKGRLPDNGFRIYILQLELKISLLQQEHRMLFLLY